MKKNSKPFKEAIKAFYQNQSMTSAQLDDMLELQQKLLDKHVNKIQETKSEHPTNTISPAIAVCKKHNILTYAIAASIALVAVTLSYFHQPDIISAAYADIIHDSRIENGFDAKQNAWLKEKNIGTAPAKFKVEMSKFCKLNGNKVTHLRLAGESKGKLNMFFYTGKRPYNWGTRSGITKGMQWEVLETRDNLTLIVIYTQDMQKQAVRQIITTMLPEATA